MTDLLTQLGVHTSGDHVARSPIDGAEIGRVAYDDAASIETKIAAQRRSVPRLARRAGAAARRAGAPVRRGAARQQGRARPPRHARSRQDPAGGPRRSAGDDRHLRFRGRSLAPALRPDHRLRASRPPHDGDLASGRPGRGDLRVQLPGRGVGVERGAGAGLRRQRDLEADREDAAHRARDAGAVRARARSVRRGAGEPLARSCSACATSAKRSRRTRASRSSAPPARRAWAASSRPSSRRASAGRFSSSAATTR